MAVDKKSDHVGNHGGSYIDNDGMTKQFTYIDHDKKTKKSNLVMTEDEKSINKKDLDKFYSQRIEQILALPAVSFLKSRNIFAEDFIVRDRDNGITWNEQFLRNALDINKDLGYIVLNSTWKNTVREQYWFQEMSHEDILAGKWKEWM